MKTKTPLLDLYYKMMKTERLTICPHLHSENGGLCEVLLDIDGMGHLSDEFRDLFAPFKALDPPFHPIYWGSGDKEARKGEFNEFRQTLWLLFAAVKGEL